MQIIFSINKQSSMESISYKNHWSTKKYDFL